MSSSRRMSRQRDDADFYRDCKACFLTIYDDIDDRIESKKTLNTLLQTSGRNPTRARLDTYWTRDTDELAFDDFLDICKKEPVTSGEDLMKAFRKIDLNGDGYISLEELYKIMNAQGENMSRDEVRKIIDEVDDNKDGRLDYNEFTNMVLKTSEESKKFAVKVMERKERKKKRIEKARLSGLGQKQLTDDLSGDGKGDNSHTNTFGSSTSLRSGRDLEQSKEPEKENFGSRTSLRADDHVHSSKVSLRSVAKDPTGSRVSLKEDSKPDNVAGSKVSLKEDPRDVHGSKVSLRSASKRSLGSKTSLKEAEKTSPTPRDVSGSRISVRSGLGDEKHGSQVSLKASAGDVSGSRVTLRSATGQASGSRVSLRSGIKADKGGDSGENSDDTIKDVDTKADDGKPTEKATSEGNGLDPKAKPKPMDTPPRSPKLSPRSEKQEEQQNSARTVGEEIEYDDDFDIVSTGRPTPRVNLNSSRKDTPTTDSHQTDNGDNKPKVKKDDKGNSHARSVDSEERASSGHGQQTRDRESTKSDDHTADKKDETKNNKDPLANDVVSSRKDSLSKSENKSDKDSLAKDENKNDKDHQAKDANKSATHETESSDTKNSDIASEKVQEEKEAPGYSRILDEIFCKSARTEKKEESILEHTIRPYRRPKEENGLKEDGAPKVVPRKDSLQKDDKESKAGLAGRLNDDDVQGSQSSLRSGDLGTPVPSPRKTLSSRLSEDDVPKPSPRVTLKGNSKGKSPSLRSSAKLPDDRTLRDWTKFTSKGCFFYEEDEIVSHVFNLKLRDDSNVFLSAHPITNSPSCLSLPSTEPVDTTLYVFDSRGRLVTSTEQCDVSGRYGVKLELTAGEYQVLPYTTGCRFKQRQADQQHQMKQAKLVKKDKDDNFVITSAFRRALEDIFELCDLDDNGTMSYEEFNWFNLRTSGEELEEDEWKVVEERTTLSDNGEITKQGFIALNEMEAEDVKGDTEDLWITLTSMGMNKALIMDEACPYRVDIYVEEVGSKKPIFKVTGIESLEKKEFADEICRNILEKGEPTKVKNMKDLYTCTYKTEHYATIVIDNRSRSTVNLEVDCSRSRNVISNRPSLDHTFEIDPQTAAIAHHLLPHSELKEWTVNVAETIHK